MGAGKRPPIKLSKWVANSWHSDRPKINIFFALDNLLTSKNITLYRIEKIQYTGHNTTIRHKVYGSIC